MPELAQSDLKRLKDFFEETSSPCDLAAFVPHTLEAINRFIGGDVICHAEVDPITASLVSQTTFADGDTPPYIRDAFERLMLTSPIFQYWIATGDVSAARTSDFISLRQWRDMPLYQEVYLQWGTEDSLAIGLPAPPGLVACFCIERATGFTEREKSLLEVARPHLALAYHNAEALTMLLKAGEDSGTYCVLLGQKRHITQASVASLQVLARCFPDEQWKYPALPSSLDRWARHRMARLDGDVPTLDMPLRLATANGEVSIRLQRGTVTGGQWLLVLQEARSARTLLDQYGLSNREKEVLKEVMRGLSSAEIAVALVISRRTVEKHLEVIYNKLGVDSRSAAIAMVLTKSPFDVAE